ncbi:L-rhamnose/proton symporter RhaT, partial [Escherichia coli]|nr:L-rhamnose/proton symporter RhaT [Escherichia coli]
MSNAITMGIFWHLIGAASAACFYAPFKKVKKWSWETMWSVGGIVSWIILPWAISALLLPNFWAYYSSFREGANKQVISSQADSLIKISRIWADFFPANTSN